MLPVLVTRDGADCKALLLQDMGSREATLSREGVSSTHPSSSSKATVSHSSSKAMASSRGARATHPSRCACPRAFHPVCELWGFEVQLQILSTDMLSGCCKCRAMDNSREAFLSRAVVSNTHPSSRVMGSSSRATVSHSSSKAMASSRDMGSQVLP